MTKTEGTTSVIQSDKEDKQAWAFKRKALTVAIAGALTLSTAYAEEQNVEQADGPAGEAEEELPMMEEVTVTAMRRNLESAQMLKREADTVIESITAEDLGSFPDKSIAEALQRVAGITVNRFAASSDTAHFSAEPSGVIVRGLNMVRTEFNGRDTFSANSSRSHVSTALTSACKDNSWSSWLPSSSDRSKSGSVSSSSSSAPIGAIAGGIGAAVGEVLLP